jgi:hypothetical protein
MLASPGFTSARLALVKHVRPAGGSGPERVHWEEAGVRCDFDVACTSIATPMNAR